MTITHNWKVNSVIKYLDTEGTVYRVLFDIESVDSDNPSFLNITTSGSVELSTETINSDEFIPFENLTVNDVLGWVKEKIIKYNIPDTDPVEIKYEYEIYNERYLKNLKETITYTPDRPYSTVGYLTTPEPEPTPDTETDTDEDVETDTDEDRERVAAEEGIPIEEWV